MPLESAEVVPEAAGTETREWLVETVCGEVWLILEGWMASPDETERCLGLGGGVGRGLALEVWYVLSAGRGLVLEVLSAGGSSS